MAVTYGVIPWTPDEYPLCVDRVRYIGDGVAAVAAVDEDTALRALKLIEVEYEPLQPSWTPSRRWSTVEDPEEKGRSRRRPTSTSPGRRGGTGTSPRW
jgi:CO/xanthine dehydrogenase Mo-binding subunit